MKSLILMFIYIATFFGMFSFLSVFGLIISKCSYLDIIRNNDWFMFYFLFVGWWIGMFPAREYYMANKEHFEDVF